MPRNVFYYKPGIGKPGARLNTLTRLFNGELVNNEVMVIEIRKILERPFADWGY